MPSLKVLSKRFHQPGTINTPTFDVPAGFRSFSIQSVMDAADLIDTGLIIDWSILTVFAEQLSNGFVSFKAGHWQGGLDIDGLPMSAVNTSWHTIGPVPVELKGEIILNKRISIGFEVDVT